MAAILYSSRPLFIQRNIRKSYGNKYRIALKNIFSRPDPEQETRCQDDNCIKVDLTPAWRDVALC